MKSLIISLSILTFLGHAQAIQPSKGPVPIVETPNGKLTDYIESMKNDCKDFLLNKHKNIRLYEPKIERTPMGFKFNFWYEEPNGKKWGTSCSYVRYANVYTKEVGFIRDHP